VTTTLLNVGLPLLKPAGSNIQLLFESMTQDDVTFLVRNEGRSGGVVRIDDLEIAAQADGDDYPEQVNILFSSNSNFIEPGKEERIFLQIDKSSPSPYKSPCDQLESCLARADEAHPHFVAQLSFEIVRTAYHVILIYEKRVSILKTVESVLFRSNAQISVFISDCVVNH
jgi:hypothetical protein